MASIGYRTSTDGTTWTDASIIAIDVDIGDIGITYNKNIGENGRLIMVFWREFERKYAYSDDGGMTWTEGDVDP